MTREQLHVEARDLFGLACQLDAENRLLRAMLARLLFAAVERRELLGFATDLIDERFPRAS